jgi:hypothetical protein
MKRLVLSGLAALSLFLAVNVAGAARADLSLPAVPGSRLTVVDPNPPPSSAHVTRDYGNPLSADEGQAWFDWLGRMDDIAFMFPEDGCYARAHLMIKRLGEHGIRADRVWAIANPKAPDDSLYVATANDPDGYVEWSWHVAPVLPVRDRSGKVRDMVFDPSLFKTPVRVDQWRDKQKKYLNSEPFICKTRAGEPPTLPDGTKAGGTGYWINPEQPDPPDADQEAHDTMLRYKRCEGKGMACVVGSDRG